MAGLAGWQHKHPLPAPGRCVDVVSAEREVLGGFVLPRLSLRQDASFDAQGLDLHMKLKTLGIASLVVALAACSSEPQKPVAGGASAPAATPPTAALAQPAQPAQPAPAAATQAVSTDANPGQINRTLLTAGYKPKVVNGQTFYCRKEDVTNTAFKKTVCLNEAQIKDQERQIKEMQREMLRSQPNPACLGPNCG